MKSPLFMLLPALLCAGAPAADWQIGASTDAVAVRYSGSRYRDRLEQARLFLNLENADSGGLTVGGSRSRLALFGADPLDQEGGYAAARLYLGGGDFPGKLSLRVAGQRIRNRGDVASKDTVSATSAQLGYLGPQRDIYLDLGYAESRYPDVLQLRQWTPTLGIGWNDGYDWLQLRGYLVRPSAPELAQGLTQSRALEGKLTHWLGAASAWLPNNLQAMWLGGKRLHAVDPDAAEIYNLPYVQRSGGYLGAEWKLGESTRLLALGGVGRFDSASLDDRFRSRSVYLNLNSAW